MTYFDDEAVPRRARLHDRNGEGECSADGGYACVDGEWDDIDRSRFGLPCIQGSFSKRCEGAE